MLNILMYKILRELKTNRFVTEILAGFSLQVSVNIVRLPLILNS
jgi:hypothetical protein